jgi:phosphinothricin acetyltransferase
VEPMPIVRPAVVEDVATLTRIYNHYVTETVVSFEVEPWTVDRRLTEWFSHYAPSGPHRLLVVEEDGQVLGYATSSPFRSRAAYATSVETSVYLAPDAGGRGLGTKLYRGLFTALEGLDLHRAYGGVALPNDASVALHRKLGFEPLGVYTEVGRKFGKYWDVAWFERPLGTSLE